MYINHFIRLRIVSYVCLVIVITVLSSPFSCLHAIPAYPYTVEVVQPDGTTLTIYLKGDEFFNYKTTTDGYLIAQNESGFYNYAQWDELKGIEATSVKANNIAFRTTEEKQLLTKLKINPDFTLLNKENRAKRISAQKSSSQPMKFPGKGSPKSLVILVNFQDVSFITPDPQKAFENLLNQEGYSENGGTGSARDYFNDCSSGVFDPEFVVVGPYTLPQNRKYYGQNDYQHSDVRPREMVIDACTMAQEAGVDFSEYDTDNDGYVDNVFIYYAGINEAESGVTETVWPHRWTLESPIDFGGVFVYDYACTSELRGMSGSKAMCGIGTFVHEFGHVLGLPDFYATNNANHVTLHQWSVMDYGSYLNDGMTPPVYSAYERFFVDWLVPVELEEATVVKLAPLPESNQAYLISHSGGHNLNGANPDSNEFIMLENRQNSGWDTYLPGHGMLITRIVYNANAWSRNTVNNSANAMGYELVRADNIASFSTLAGDPFPGTNVVRTYSPTLRDGTDIEKPITNILEIGGNIYFNFIEGDLSGMESGLIVEEEIQPFYHVYDNEKDMQEVKIAIIGEDAELQVYLEGALEYDMQVLGEETEEWHRSFEFKTENSVLEDKTLLIRYNHQEGIDHTAYLIIEKNGVGEKILELNGYFIDRPTLLPVTDVTHEGFTVNWNDQEHVSGYYITVVKTEDKQFMLTEGFDNGLAAPEDWVIEAHYINSNPAYHGEDSPAIRLYDNEYIETEEYILPVRKFSFYVAPAGVEGIGIVEAWNQEGWFEIAQFQPYKTTLTYELDKEYYKLRVSYKGSSYLNVDDFSFVFDNTIEHIEKNKWIEENTYILNGLVDNASYLYRVRAGRKIISSAGVFMNEYITPFSFTDSTTTLTGLEQTQLTFREILMLAYDKGLAIKVFNMIGQQVAVLKSADELSKLLKGQIYILQIGDARFKLAL